MATLARGIQTQVCLTEHDYVIDVFATNRSISRSTWPFCHGDPRRTRVIPDSYCTNAADVSHTECVVSAADQVTRRFAPRKGISHLARDRSAVGLFVTLMFTGRDEE